MISGASSMVQGRAAADVFTARDVITDANGTEHVRFERTFRGLPVIGGDVVIHSRGGRQLDASQRLKASSRPAVAAKITGDQAVVEAGARFGTGFTSMPTTRMVIYARDRAPTLAYEVRYSGIKADQTPTDMHYFIDANTGRVLDQWDTVATAGPGPESGCAAPIAALGTGKSMFLGDVPINTARCGSSFQLLDTTRGGGTTTNMGNRTAGFGSVMTDADNVWGNSLASNSATVAVDAHYGVSATWDYYRSAHNRLGIANDGRGALSRVHYGRNYGNAFWSDACFCMTFGDGDGVVIAPLVALDIAGHEMSHGVNSRTAGLVYSGEAGGLNEANSDIMGTMVEYFANDPSDPGDYLIGEKLFKNNPGGTLATRYMFKPSLDTRSPDCYSPTLGSLDVHFSAGVGNHFYYLLAEGTVVPAGFGAGTAANLTPASLVCRGPTQLLGIGRQAAGRIWYRALTVYMTSTATYADARVATMSAAADLYGAGSVQHAAVAAAWNAVSVN